MRKTVCGILLTTQLVINLEQITPSVVQSYQNTINRENTQSHEEI